IQAETILEGLEAGLPQAVSSGLSLVLAPGLVLTCPSAHSGPEGTASEAPPTRLRKAFLAHSTLLESPEPLEKGRGAVLPRAPSTLHPCPAYPWGPHLGELVATALSPPSLPSSSTFSLFSSGRWNPSVKVRVRKSQSQGRAG
uniref:Uncharacterized protein n=1 Tax=Mandrillus leucophaeus TaxID=9568 RepID=A0A2K6AAI1_MANLE